MQNSAYKVIFILFFFDCNKKFIFWKISIAGQKVNLEVKITFKVEKWKNNFNGFIKVKVKQRNVLSYSCEWKVNYVKLQL